MDKVKFLAVAWVSVIGLVAAPSNILGQRVECTLMQTLPDLVSGECSGMPAESAIALQPVPGSSTSWRGAITIGTNPGLIEIVRREGQTGPEYVFRSTIDWFNVEVWEPLGSPGQLAFDRSDVAAPSAEDLEILERTRELLLSASVWDRRDDRNCINDAAGTRGLYCALLSATVEERGRYYHRQPALQRVRRAIDERWRARITSHRLMDFNNHPDTTFDEVLAVLERGRKMIEADRND